MHIERLKKLFELNQPNTQMTEDETRILMGVFTSKDPDINLEISKIDKTSETYKQLKPLIECLQVQIFLKRLEKLTTLRISLGALLVMAQYFDSPGIAVMYAYYLHTKLPANTFIDTMKISMDLFPWGFFSIEQLNSIWDAQKVKKDDNLAGYTCIGAPDNLLDYLEIWKP